MVLYVIGLGLGGEKDITVRGLEAVRGSTEVILEHFGPLVAGADKANLEEFYGKDIVLADPDLPDGIYATAKDEDVSFLVVGDPFRNNTQPITDLITQAREQGVQVEVIHNVSTPAAVVSCGLNGAKFGQDASVPTWNENWKPDSFFDVIKINRENGMHTLCLLDIKAETPNVLEASGGEVSSITPHQYTCMSVGTAIRQLLEVATRKSGSVYGPDTQCVAFARLAQPTQQVVAGKMSQLLGVDFGEPPYSLVICGKTDPDEDKLLEWYTVAATDDSIEQSLVEQRCLLNCPGLHGLAAFTTPNDFNCDICLGLIPEGSQAYGCHQCNHDACTNCSIAADGSVAVVEASGEVAEALNCPGLHGLSAFTTPNDFKCSICLGSIPKGSQAYGCRQCNHDACANCSIAADGNVAVVKASGGAAQALNCPGLHGLSAFTTPNDFKCDICLGSIPEGSQAYGCRQCNYDACTNCSTGHATGGSDEEAPTQVQRTQQAISNSNAMIAAMLAKACKCRCTFSDRLSRLPCRCRCNCTTCKFRDL